MNIFSNLYRTVVSSLTQNSSSQSSSASSAPASRIPLVEVLGLISDSSSGVSPLDPSRLTSMQALTSSLDEAGVVEASSVEKVQITYEEIVQNSRAFSSRYPFPTQHHLAENLGTTRLLRAEIQEHANQTFPILHDDVFSIIAEMIELKREHGSAVEKRVYQDITVDQFIDRLIQKRPLVFVGREDHFLPRNRPEGQYAQGFEQQHAGGFETIGTDQERGELRLENYQSYFEMSLSAFLSAFGPTHFINQGARHNHGEIGQARTYESKGIFAGMVGARFEKEGLMEWAHMVITPEQNRVENGYGKDADPEDPKTKELKLWAKLYKSGSEDDFNLPSYDEAVADMSGRYRLIADNRYLDTHVYKERMKLIVEPFLLESNQRAREQEKAAYLHVIGLGLGVWQLDRHQNQLLVEVYLDLLREYAFDHISDVDFSWFNLDETAQNLIRESMGEHPITIHFSRRNAADKLMGADEGKLLIAQYPSDSNAYPGNEYWEGYLNSSGNPAAGCCSMITELQNPDINSNFRAKNLKLKGESTNSFVLK